MHVEINFCSDKERRVRTKCAHIHNPTLLPCPCAPYLKETGNESSRSVEPSTCRQSKKIPTCQRETAQEQPKVKQHSKLKATMKYVADSNTNNYVTLMKTGTYVKNCT